MGVVPLLGPGSGNRVHIEDMALVRRGPEARISEASNTALHRSGARAARPAR